MSEQPSSPQTDASLPPDIDQQVEAVAEEFLDKLQAGEAPDPQTLLAAHPDIADRLVRRLELVERVHRLAQARRSASPQPPGRGEQAIRIKCPHCGNGIQLVEPELQEVICQNCGSSFHVDPRATTPYRPGALPETIGKFEVVELLGRGAFGTVYKARDPELDRTVAIKVPRTGYFDTQEEEERFLREARSTAQLHHQSIVQVHEIGHDKNVPYIVSDYVQGLTLADVLTGRRPSFRESAEMVAQIADALEYAHRAKVIHHDIKPSNILIDAEGRPHITDFGLARREEGEITVTLDGQVLGTPAYMSPEQAAGDRQQIDARSDVYSLGVVLYELLAGELPFRGNKRMLLHQVLHDEPRPPRSLNDRIPRDLETICLKAMAKEPGRRYSSAAEMADDLRRHLRGDAIRARPVGRVERLWRWCRRNPAVAGLTAAVAMALLLGTSGASYFAWRANEKATAEAGAKDEARRALARAERNHYVNRIVLAHREARDLNDRRANQLLEECPAELRGWEWHFLKRTYRREVLAIPQPHEVGVFGLAYSRDGRHLALLRGDDTVHIHDAATGEWVRAIPNVRAADREENRVGRPSRFSLAYSGDGTRLATACNDRTFHVWDVRTGERLLECRGHTGCVVDVIFNRDGTYLASAAYDNTVRLWDARSGKELQSWQNARAVAFHPHGRRLATCNTDGTVRLWEAATGREARMFQAGEKPAGGFTLLAFRPDGEQLAASFDRDRAIVQVWGTATGKEVRTLRAADYTGDWARALRWSPDGRLLALGATDKDNMGGLTLWDLRAGETLRARRRYADGIEALAFDPAGPRVAVSTGYDRSGPAVRVCGMWTGVEATAYGDPDPAAGFWQAVVAEDSGRVLALATVLDQDEKAQEPTRLWDIQARRPLLALPMHSRSAAALCPSTRRVATSTEDGTVMVWDGHTGKQLVRFPAHADRLDGLRFGPGGGRLASWANSSKGPADEAHWVKLWDAATGRLLHHLKGHTKDVGGIAFRPDGQRLATTGVDGCDCGMPMEGDSCGQPRSERMRSPSRSAPMADSLPLMPVFPWRGKGRACSSSMRRLAPSG